MTIAHTQLSRVAEQVSQTARTRFDQILSDQAATARRRLEERQEEARKEEAERLRVAAGIARRLPRARTGLSAFMELGRTSDIQKILASFREPYSPVIEFYKVARVTGWYWDASKDEIRRMEKQGGVLECDAEEDGMRVYSRRSPYDEEHLSVIFRPDHLLFSSGAAISLTGGIGYTVCYEPDEAGRQVIMEGTRVNRNETVLTLEEFLQEIARPDPVNMGAISHPGQRSHKWEPEEVFFQLLVSCSRPYVFDRYLASCLEYLQEKSAALDLF